MEGAPLLDGDIFAFRAACACKDDEPESHARYTAKRMLENVIDQFDRGLSYRLFLTGTGNYRYHVAKEQGYKANRTQPKPKYLPVVREYMIEHWRAEVIDGREADDAIGCAQSSDTCIVTIDKDLDMIPGAHYNPIKDRYYVMDEESAWRAFFSQLLTGDRTDNIAGVHGIGPKKAAAALAGKGRVAMERAVVDIYKDRYGSRALELLAERGALLWIQRVPGEIWSP